MGYSKPCWVMRTKRPLSAITLITPPMSYDLVKKSLKSKQKHVIKWSKVDLNKKKKSRENITHHKIAGFDMHGITFWWSVARTWVNSCVSIIRQKGFYNIKEFFFTTSYQCLSYLLTKYQLLQPTLSELLQLNQTVRTKNFLSNKLNQTVWTKYFLSNNLNQTVWTKNLNYNYFLQHATNVRFELQNCPWIFLVINHFITNLQIPRM